MHALLYVLAARATLATLFLFNDIRIGHQPDDGARYVVRLAWVIVPGGWAYYLLIAGA